MRLKDEQKVAQIFQATLKLVAQSGLAGISMAAIAKEANIGTGTLYTYFKSKEDLINTLYKEVRKTYSTKVFMGLAINEPVKIALRKIWVNYLAFRVDCYEEGIFQDQYWVSPYIKDNHEFVQSTREMMAPLTEVLERGKKEQLIKNLENRLFIINMVGYAGELATIMRFKDFKMTPEFIEDTFSLFWDALKS